MAEFTHLDDHGRAAMVDVTAKPETYRRAEARCRVVGGSDGPLPWVDDARRLEVIGEARMAGIFGAKATSSLVPLCHPLPLTGIDVTLRSVDGGVEVRATVETVSRTGVEMEALAACGLAALAVVGALAHDHPTTEVRDLTLWSKTGGRSGSWERDEAGMHPSPAGADPSTQTPQPPVGAGPESQFDPDR
jgi:cyclic pyranopterin phosphate synthase